MPDPDVDHGLATRYLASLAGLTGAEAGLAWLPSGGASGAPVLLRGTEVGRVLAKGGPPDLAERAAALLEAHLRGEAEVVGMADDLLERYEELSLITGIGRALTGVFDEPRICAIGLEHALEAAQARRAFVTLRVEERLHVGASTQDEPAFAGGLASDDGITWTAVETGRHVLLHADEPWPRAGRDADDAQDAVLSVPLLSSGDAGSDPDVLGAITLVGAAGDRFTAARSELTAAIAVQVALALQATRLVASLRSAELFAHDLELAAEIQAGLLPRAAPEDERFAVASRCLPAANVGGDYFDHVVDPRGRLSVVIADVAGHSVGSALLMAMARVVVRRELLDGHAPGQVLDRLNASLFDDLERSALFITVFCARLDPATGELRYASAGHDPALLRRAGGTIEELTTDGLPTGVLDNERFEERATTLRRGDVLLLHTDGVTERHDPGEALFGPARLHEVVAATGQDGPAAVVEAVLDAVSAFGAGRPADDDVTLLAVKLQA